jgi:hypothetical protein
MRLERQIKMLAALEVTLVSFTTWTALISLLLKELADYRLLFLSLCLTLLMQYIFARKNNKYLAIILPILVGMPFLVFLRNSSVGVSNIIYIIVSLTVNLKHEELAIEYEEYRLKTKQGAAILGVIALVSLWMDKEAADYIYRFVVNYIIAAVVLLRESRAYCYKVVKDPMDAETIKQAGIFKIFVIDLLFKYGVVIISTLILSTNWVLDKSVGVINTFSRAANSIIGGILDIVKVIIGPILLLVVDTLSRMFSGATFSIRMEELKEGLRNIFKTAAGENGGATASDEVFLYNTLKAVALLIIVLFIVDAVYKMKFLKHKSEQYVEEKEKIYNHKNEYKNINGKDIIAKLFKKVLKSNMTLRDKILNAYRDFEKTTFKAGIYKPHMTATELREKTSDIMKDHTYLDEMTETYNEVKFSTIDPEEGHLDIVKKAVESVKRQLGRNV